MNKIYYNTIGNVRPSDSAVEKAVEAALRADRSGKVKEMKIKHSYIKPLSAAAACMALIIALGAVFFPKSDNTFYVNASAAEVNKNYDYMHSQIGAYSTESSEEQSVNTKTGKSTFVLEYDLTDFYISGKNIESVTMKANKNCTYFDILKDKKAFTNTETNRHTQYKKDELGMIKHGCDSFTYVNRNPSAEEQKIMLGGKIAFVLEGYLKNPKIVSNIKKLGENLLKKGKTKEEETAVYKEETRLESEIVKDTLTDATIDVKVRFTDGTEKVQTIAVDYYYDSSLRDTQWITFTLG